MKTMERQIFKKNVIKQIRLCLFYIVYGRVTLLSITIRLK